MSGKHRFSLFLLLSAGSLLIMVIVDYVLGPEAEFLNAWSVAQRLAGLPSTVNSLIYHKLGALGELICVLLVNMLIGALLTLLFNLPGMLRERRINE